MSKETSPAAVARLMTTISQLPSALALLGLGLASSACSALPPASVENTPDRGLELARPPRSSNKVLIPRKVPAHGHLRGSVPAGSQVLWGEKNIPVSASGLIDWPIPAAVSSLPLRIIGQDGRVLLHTVEVSSDKN